MLTTIKWTEAFIDFLNRKIGVREIPLIRAIRAQVTSVMVLTDLATDLLHSTEHGFVECNLIDRASHTHPLFRDENAQIYYDLEIAL